MLNDFKQLSFENNHLRIKPVPRTLIAKTEQLPLFSIAVTETSTQATEVVYYDIEKLNPNAGWHDAARMVSLSRQITEAMENCGLIFADREYAFVNAQFEHLAGQMRDAYNGPLYGKNPLITLDPTVMVPMYNRATLFLLDNDSSRIVGFGNGPDEWKTHVLLRGMATFFGREVHWAIHHPAVKHGAFDVDIGALTREAAYFLAEAFDFLKGNVELRGENITIEV